MGHVLRARHELGLRQVVAALEACGIQPVVGEFHRQQLPAGTYQVKVVCPADSANPGWAPVKSVSVEVGEDVGLRVDCDNKSVENF